MASTMSNVHKIVVNLSETDVTVDPGSVTQLTITVTNLQDSPDRLALEIEGIDVEWYAVPVPAINLSPGSQGVFKVPFRVARASSNMSGTYPFLVRIQAMETGAVGVAQGSLHVKAFTTLQLELSPKRAISTFFRPLNDFTVKLTNLGNTEETLDLFASDPDDGCAYEYDLDRIMVKPGQSQVVPLAVRPKSSSLLGGVRLYGFSASARSIDDSFVSANAHGQIEKHALVSPLFGILTLLAALVGGVLYIFRPQPPQPIKINNFDVEKRKLVSGEQTTLTWDVSTNCQSIVLAHRVGVSGRDIVDSQLKDTVGHLLVTPASPSTTYTLTVHGIALQKDQSRSVKIDVTPAPVIPKPTIQKFEVDPLVVHQGETVKFSWEAKGQENFIFYPGNKNLPATDLTLQDTPIDNTEYTLRAYNKTGYSEKKVRVRVVPVNVSIAEISYFTHEPHTVFIDEEFTLSWKTKYARSVHIDSSDATINIGEVNTSGSSKVTLTGSGPVVLTITATDSANKTTTQTLKIVPKPKPIPKIPDPTTDPGTSGVSPPPPDGAPRQ